MNNLLSYCGLVDAKIRASDKDLPVLTTHIFAVCEDKESAKKCKKLKKKKKCKMKKVWKKCLRTCDKCGDSGTYTYL